VRTARDDARAAIVDRGVTCFRETTGFSGALSPQQLDLLTSLAVEAGGPNHWLLPGDLWASAQGWIGALDIAVSDLRGTLVGSDASGTWVIVERDGRAAAVSFREVDLPNGMTVWLRNDVMFAVAC
jgi:hypothetical protein